MIKFEKLRLVIVEGFDAVNHFECVARYLNQRPLTFGEELSSG
jgi:hypothetical protein